MVSSVPRSVIIDTGMVKHKLFFNRNVLNFLLIYMCHGTTEKHIVCIEFDSDFTDLVTETYRILVQVFGNEVLSKSKTFERYNYFKQRVSVQKD